MADAAGHRDGGTGLEFSGGTFRVLCPRSGGGCRRTAFCRAQCRAGDNRVHASYPPAIQPLDYALGNSAGTAARRGVGRRLEVAGAATVDSDIFGVAMTASMRFGADLHRDGVTFRLWAPAAKRVEVMLDRAHAMQPRAAGWHELTIGGLGAGALYKYRIDGELEVPDPASHFQPQDVAGPSEVVDHGRYRW